MMNERPGHWVNARLGAKTPKRTKSKNTARDSSTQYW